MRKYTIEEIDEKIGEFLKREITHKGFNGGVLGISGGVDSAVMAALLVKHLGKENILGLVLPCHSHEGDLDDAMELINKFQINHKIIDLGNTYDTLINDSLKDNKKLCDHSSMVFGNVKARLRMSTLYFYGGLRNYLVVGTCNLSEVYTGYYTKYGDGGVDIEPLGDLLKEEIYELGAYLGVPESILLKKPMAGLTSLRTDEEEMGFSYSVLDKYIATGEGSPSDIERIKKIHRNSEHKRRMPNILKF